MYVNGGVFSLLAYYIQVCCCCRKFDIRGVLLYLWHSWPLQHAVLHNVGHCSTCSSSGIRVRCKHNAECSVSCTSFASLVIVRKAAIIYSEYINPYYRNWIGEFTCLKRNIASLASPVSSWSSTLCLHSGVSTLFWG